MKESLVSSTVMQVFRATAIINTLSKAVEEAERLPARFTYLRLKMLAQKKRRMRTETKASVEKDGICGRHSKYSSRPGRCV